MKKYLIVGVAGMLAFLATATVKAESVEIALKHNLDGFLNGYCLDISGGGPDIDPSNGLQVHTCYSYRGELGKDQIFATEEFTKNKLYMPEFAVCAQVAGVTAGSKVTLAACGDNKLQDIVFLEDGTIRPTQAQDLCFSASLSTRRGRNGTSDHQIKDLTLAECSAERAIFQQWYTRTKLQ